MKKILFSSLLCLSFVMGSFASSGISVPTALTLEKKFSELQQQKGFDVQGICKGSAVVINHMGQVQVVQMGNPGEVIITDTAGDCQRMFNSFIEELSYSFRVVVFESDYDAL